MVAGFTSEHPAGLRRDPHFRSGWASDGRGIDRPRGGQPPHEQAAEQMLWSAAGAHAVVTICAAAIDERHCGHPTTTARAA